MFCHAQSESCDEKNQRETNAKGREVLQEKTSELASIDASCYEPSCKVDPFLSWVRSVLCQSRNDISHHKCDA